MFSFCGIHKCFTCKPVCSYKKVNYRLRLFCQVQQYHRVAIVGCGIAGLSLCYYLCKLSAAIQRPCHITVFDPCRPGSGGASKVAAGLLHPFSPNSKLLWNGQEAFQTATQLIRHVESHLDKVIIHNIGRRKRFIFEWFVRLSIGICRLALTEKQHRKLQQASVTFAHLVHLFEDRELQHLLGWNSSAISGLLLKDACTIDTHEYLEGLWNLCMHFGTVDWRPEMVSRLERLEQSNEFQDVVVCAGADTNFIDGISGTVPITRCFGRNFYYRWNESAIDQNTLEMPIICGKYLIPYKDRTRFVAGATFEKEQPLSTLHQLSDDYEMADIHSRLEELVPGILQQMQFIYSDVRQQISNKRCETEEPKTTGRL